MAKIGILVAVSLNGVIGKDNQLLWKLSDDLKNFKKITSNQVVLMGRKTFESIGRPLPNRINVIVTKNEHWKCEGVLVFDSLEKALSVCANQFPDKIIYVIGGGEIYKQTIGLCDELIVTKVDSNFEGDTFFEFDEIGFEIIKSEKYSKNEKNEYDFEVIYYKRK